METSNNIFYSKQIYCGSTFQMYIRDKYYISDAKLFNNHNILLLIYAYEWFNYNTNVSKVKFHPYLTFKDNDKLNEFTYNNKLALFGGSIGVYILSFLVLNKGTKLYLNQDFSKKLKIVFKSVILSGSFFGLYYSFVYKRLVNSYIEKELSDYLTLNVDKNLLKNDLIKYKIIKDNTLTFSENGVDNFLKEVILLSSSPEELSKLSNNKIENSKVKTKKTEIKLG